MTNEWEYRTLYDIVDWIDLFVPVSSPMPRYAPNVDRIDQINCFERSLHFVRAFECFLEKATGDKSHAHSSERLWWTWNSCWRSTIFSISLNEDVWMRISSGYWFGIACCFDTSEDGFHRNSLLSFAVINTNLKTSNLWRLWNSHHSEICKIVFVKFQFIYRMYCNWKYRAPWHGRYVICPFFRIE